MCLFSEWLVTKFWAVSRRFDAACLQAYKPILRGCCVCIALSMKVYAYQICAWGALVEAVISC
jgi:hypothetical protein